MTYLDYTMTELEELECAYVELHKAVYGVKARRYRATSLAQVRSDLDNLQREGEAVWAAEKVEQQKAGVRFEKRVDETIEMGAKNRETALRWIRAAEGCTDDDTGFLEYKLNLPYGYLSK